MRLNYLEYIDSTRTNLVGFLYGGAGDSPIPRVGDRIVLPSKTMAGKSAAYKALSVSFDYEDASDEPREVGAATYLRFSNINVYLTFVGGYR